MPTVHASNNFFFVTAALVLLLICSAWVSSTPDGENHRWLEAFMFGTQLVAYFFMNLSRAWRRFVIVMLLIVLGAEILREFFPLSVAPTTALMFYLVFIGGMCWAAARQVLFTGRNELNTIAGAVAVYLLMGLLWTILYLLALEAWPDGFNGIEHRDWHDNFGHMAYYSYITMSTVGYGDISPTIPMTRMLAVLQAITGTFYLAVVVASLVGARHRKSD